MTSHPRGLRVKPMGNSLALHSCAKGAKHQHMVQRVGYFIVFLSLLIGGTAFLMWIAP